MLYRLRHMYLLTYLLMELSPSWEAANCAATRELPSILWNPEAHYRVHKSPPLVPILSQIDPIHSIPSYLSKIHFNIVICTACLKSKSCEFCIHKFFIFLKINISLNNITRFVLLRRLAACIVLVSCVSYSSALKMMATCSSETSVGFRRTTRRYIAEDITFHSHRCHNLKSYASLVLFLQYKNFIIIIIIIM
jgi:hypothetical protein